MALLAASKFLQWSPMCSTPSPHISGNKTVLTSLDVAHDRADSWGAVSGGDKADSWGSAGAGRRRPYSGSSRGGDSPAPWDFNGGGSRGAWDGAGSKKY